MSRKVITTTTVEHRTDAWDYLRDQLRVACGKEPLDEWDWHPKPIVRKAPKNTGKNNHFSDAYYRPRTTTKKKSRPNIESITKIAPFNPALVLAVSGIPIDKPKQTFKSVKIIAKKKVQEPVEQPTTQATIEDME